MASSAASFGYTSPTFTIPQIVKFRYRLDGYDHDWNDAGTRRQAFYTDLPPGKYSFRVIASIRDGVWNESAAKLDFSIAPAYYQTNWFRALCAMLLLLLAWAGYQLRMRRLHRQFEMTLNARVAERTRIARDLHGTLLQGFHGLLLRFQTALNLLPDRPSESKQVLASAIDNAAGPASDRARRRASHAAGRFPDGGASRSARSGTHPGATFAYRRSMGRSLNRSRLPFGEAHG